MFMITQVLGVMICLKLINTNITVQKQNGIIGTLIFFTVYFFTKVLLFKKGESMKENKKLKFSFLIVAMISLSLLLAMIPTTFNFITIIVEVL